MLRFCCEKCGCKISVQDENAGRKAKCPKCNSVLVIPVKTKTIDFECQNCGQKISVPRKNSGKEGRCPNCKNLITVPGELKLQDLLEKKPEAVENTGEQGLNSGQSLQEAEDEDKTQRRLPWFFDIFLYPTSLSGLSHLAIFVIITLVSTILGLVGLILRFLMGFYIGWYFTECVRDSAKGNIRAPEAFASMGLGEMWAQIQHIVGPYLLFLTPALFYNLFTHNYDALYWGLLVAGSFFFPMSLLACIMFDSASGLNPILLIGSIFSTFLQYCGLVLLVIGIIFSFTFLANITGSSNANRPQAITLIFGGVSLFLTLYTVFIIAHLIGRFYWRNEEKLNWEC